MKLICLVKFIPDVQNFKYDYEKNVLVRDSGVPILNPDDACALAFALKIKDRYPDTTIEMVSMAPMSILPNIEDLLRRNVDKATLISDSLYVGSDTYATSKILGAYLCQSDYDCMLTGTHTLDGDTAHIPTQLAELLHLNQLSNIVRIEEDTFGKEDKAIVEVEYEQEWVCYETPLPAVLSISKDSKYKLPFVRYKDLDLDVSAKITVISNEELCLSKDEVGLGGSLTKVVRTYVKKREKKEKIVVQNSDEGIEVVYQFLKEKGFV